MKHQLLNSIQGQSLTALLAYEQMDSICATLSSSTTRYPRVRKFRPTREERPFAEPARKRSSASIRYDMSNRITLF